MIIFYWFSKPVEFDGIKSQILILRIEEVRIAYVDFPGENFSKKISRTQKLFSGSFRHNFATNFSREFPKKFFPAHATITRFAIFQKCRIAPFARISSSKSPPHVADPANRNEKTALPSIPAKPSPAHSCYRLHCHLQHTFRSPLCPESS